MPQEFHATLEQPEPLQAGVMDPAPRLAIWTCITFVILLVILKKLAWGPILENLDKRESAIRDSLAAAERAAASAQSSIEEQNRLLQEARRQAQELQAEGRANAERSREELLARARGESERLVEAGRQAIEQEKRAALNEIRKTAVDLALAASSKLLRAQVDDAKNRELVQGYVRELEQQTSRKDS
jgi:F-type H+-transporting ATPase subunit b